ncbi:MAG: hypothetical protein WAN87_06415 [Thermoplasmata archaeon]
MGPTRPGVINVRLNDPLRRKVEENYPEALHREYEPAHRNLASWDRSSEPRNIM